VAGDTANFKATATIDFSDAKKAAADLANAIAQLNGMLEKSNPELTRAQTGLAKLASGGAQAAKGIQQAAQATKGWAQSLSSVNAKQFSQTLSQIDKIQSSLSSGKLNSSAAAGLQQSALGFNTSPFDQKTATMLATMQQGLSTAKQRTDALAQSEKVAAQEAQAMAKAQSDTTANAALSHNAQQLAKLRAANQGVNQSLQERIDATTGVTRATTGMTAANSAFNKTNDQMGIGLAATQYALYNVASTLTSVGRGLIAFSTAPAAAAISFQSDFAQVSRTVTGATGDMMRSLEDLSTQIPATFADITEIASLGGQLGIASGDIVDFTSVVAKLTATTNLSAEEAGTLLGRFQEMTDLPASKFENLASAVLAVGINSVATEKQIAQIASALAGVSRTSGFTAPQLIALSGALGSIGSGARQVQAASGSITRFLSNLQTDISKSNVGLSSFAKTAGVSADTVRKTFGTDKFAGVFDKFIQGLHDIQPQAGAVNQVLRDIGLTGVQDQRVFNNLGAASKLLSSLIKTSADAFRSAAVLNTQYNKIADTTAAKIKVLSNTFQVLLADLGNVSGGAAGGIASWLTDILKRFDELARNPVVQVIAAVVAGFTGLLGVLSLVGGGSAIAIAGIIALTRSIVGLTGAEITSTTVSGMLTEALGTLGTAGKVAAVGIKAAGVALKALTIAGIVFAGIEIGSGLAGWVYEAQGVIKTTKDLENAAKKGAGALGKDLGGAIQQWADGFAKMAQLSRVGIKIPDISKLSGSKQLQAVLGANSNMAGLFGNDLNNLFGSLNISPLSKDVQNLDKAMANMVKNGQTLKAADIFDTAVKGAKEAGRGIDTVNGEFSKYTAALKEAKAEQGELAQATGVTSDFISQLADATEMSVDDIEKFGAAYAKSVQPLTDLNSAIQQVQQAQANATAAAKAGQSVSQYLAAQNKDQAVSLSALTEQYNTNNKSLQTWNNNLKIVAARYGEDVAQQFIQAGYSATENSILQQLTDAAPKQGEAYVAAMRKNADLAGQAMADQVLASGVLMTAGGQEVGGKTADAITKAMKAGVSIDTIMQQFNLQLKGNPLKPKADTKPAMGTINSFLDAYSNKKIPMSVSAATGAAQSQLDAFLARNQYREVQVYVNQHNTAAPGSSAYWGFRAAGGKINGPGSETSDSVPTMLSRNEWVIRAAAVRKYGDGFMDALNRGRVRTFAGGGTPRAVAAPSGGTTGIVELGPTSLRALSREVVNHIMLDDTAIYNASRRGAAKAGNQGRY